MARPTPGMRPREDPRSGVWLPRLGSADETDRGIALVAASHMKRSWTAFFVERQRQGQASTRPSAQLGAGNGRAARAH